MGWFSTPEEARREDVRSGRAVPTRAERQRCWAARDLYFACLDGQTVLNKSQQASPNAQGPTPANPQGPSQTFPIVNTTTKAGAEAGRRACPEETKRFEADCAAQWVQYFREWRVAEHMKRVKLEKLREQGAIPMDLKPEWEK